MKTLLSLNIDVTKIDKSKLYQGEKGTYLELTVALDDQPDQYGRTVSAWISQSKEERQVNTPRTFVGNGKTLWSGQGASQAQAPPQNKPQGAPPQNYDSDDLPW